MTIERREVEILEVRESVPGEMELDGLIVPYGERAEILPGQWERFEPGSLRWELPIPLRDEHRATIGRAQDIVDTDRGPVATFRISDTQLGRDAYTLARDGAYRSLSVGFIPEESSREGDTVVRRRAKLVEVSLVGLPAYAGAVVTEVRGVEEVDQMEQERSEMEQTIQHEIDEARTVLAEARAVAQEMLESRNAPTIEEARTRGHEYRSMGEVISDTIQHGRGRSAEATQRLEGMIDAGVVSRDGREILLRAFPTPGNSVGNGVAYDAFIPALLELLREGRPTADLFISSPTLPSEGNKVFFPAVSVGNTVAFQDGQNVDVDSTTQTQILTDWPKSTIAGGQGLSIQSQLWTSPNYLDSVVRDLIAAHNEYLDWAAINGDPTVQTPVSSTGYTGILTAGATDVPVGGTGSAEDIIGKVGAAWAAVYAGSRRSPIAAVMASSVWGLLLDAVDTDSRPLISTEAPSNPAGIGNAASVAGTLRSIPVVLDDNTPDDVIIVSSFRDAHLLEDAATPVQVSLTYPDTLTTDVAIYSFSALAIRRPAAFAVMSGVVVP